MMFLAVDIGNSFTKFGLFKQEEPFEMVFAFPTASLVSGENIENELLPKLSALGDLDKIVIASVVPKATDAAKKIFERTRPEAIVRILKNTDIPIVNNYENPDQVGIDRLLGSFAAYRIWGKISAKPAIVINFGTATTLDCITEKGEYLGGIIAPGVKLGAESLAHAGAQLPEIQLAFPEHIVGRTTEESMQSGVIFGAMAMIEGLITHLQQEAFPNKETIVVATGGLSKLFEGKIPRINYVAPNLILEGIALSISDGTSSTRSKL